MSTIMRVPFLVFTACLVSMLFAQSASATTPTSIKATNTVTTTGEVTVKMRLDNKTKVNQNGKTARVWMISPRGHFTRLGTVSVSPLYKDEFFLAEDSFKVPVGPGLYRVRVCVDPMAAPSCKTTSVRTKVVPGQVKVVHIQVQKQVTRGNTATLKTRLGNTTPNSTNRTVVTTTLVRKGKKPVRFDVRAIPGVSTKSHRTLTLKKKVTAPVGVYNVRTCVRAINQTLCHMSKSTLRVVAPATSGPHPIPTPVTPDPGLKPPVPKPAHLSALSDSLHFGDVAVGETSDPETLSIKNTGESTTGTLSVSTPPGFSVVDHTCGALAAGAECSVTVVSTPTSSGLLTGLVIVSDGATSTGIGVTSVGFVPATLTIDKTEMDFYSIVLGDSSDTRTVKVTNTGERETGILSVTFDEPFVVTVGACEGKTLDAEESCEIYVSYEPVTSGPDDTTLVVTDGTTSATSELSGTGLAPADLSANVSERDFEEVVTDSSSDATVPIFKNDGDVTTKSLTAEINGGDFDITVDNCTDNTLVANESCEVTVVFTPLSTGPLNAELTVSDGTTSYSVALTGIGLAPAELASSANDVDFGSLNIEVDEPVTETVTFTNVGDVDTGLLSSDLTGDDVFTITADTCVGHLMASSSCSVTVQYAPQDVNTHSGSLVVGDGTIGKTVPLAGAGVPNTTTLSVTGDKGDPAHIHPYGEYDTVTLTNTGSAPAVDISHKLQYTNYSGDPVDAPGGASFEITNDTCAGTTLAPGDSCTLRVSVNASSYSDIYADLEFKAENSEETVIRKLWGCLMV